MLRFRVFSPLKATFLGVLVTKKLRKMRNLSSLEYEHILEPVRRVRQFHLPGHGVDSQCAVNATAHNLKTKHAKYHFIYRKRS